MLSTISGNAEFPADGGDFGDGEDRELGIGQGLRIIGAGAPVRGAAEIFGVGRVDEADFDALVLQRVGEEIPGAAVEIGGGDDIVADAREVLHGIGGGRLSRGDAQRRRAAFERGQPLFEDVGRGVAEPRIDVAELFQREEVGGVFRVAELVGGGLEDRRGDGAGRRVGAPARMKDKGFGLFRIDGHCAFSRRFKFFCRTKNI